MEGATVSEFTYHVKTEPERPSGESRIWHVLVGPKGAVQFMVLRLPARVNGLGLGDIGPYVGADVGYHAREPQYDGQGIIDCKCPWVDGPCYYDGSSLRAMEWAKRLYSLPAGEQENWLRISLREEYEAVFGGGGSSERS